MCVGVPVVVTSVTEQTRGPHHREAQDQGGRQLVPVMLVKVQFGQQVGEGDGKEDSAAQRQRVTRQEGRVGKRRGSGCTSKRRRERALRRRVARPTARRDRRPRGGAGPTRTVRPSACGSAPTGRPPGSTESRRLRRGDRPRRRPRRQRRSEWTRQVWRPNRRATRGRAKVRGMT